MLLLSDPTIWLDLVILTLLEVVLGVDNIVFIVLASNRLPKQQQLYARRIGLLLAMLMRLGLLAVIFWLSQLTMELFSIMGHGFSIRNVIELLGGGFLIVKASQELRAHYLESSHNKKASRVRAVFWLVLLQIVLLDSVFSLDSVLTAVAIAEHYFVMASAIIIAIIVMVIASEVVNDFINKYSRVKLLAIILILLVGLMLFVKGFGVYISEWYLYAAIILLGVVILPPWRKLLQQMF